MSKDGSPGLERGGTPPSPMNLFSEIYGVSVSIVSPKSSFECLTTPSAVYVGTVVLSHLPWPLSQTEVGPTGEEG